MYTENTLETNYLKLFELYPNTKDSLHQPVAGDGAGAGAGHGGGVRGGGGGRGRTLSLRHNTVIAAAVAVVVAAGHLGDRGRPAVAAVPHRLPRDPARVGVQGRPRPAPALAQRGAVRRRGAGTEKNIS